MRSSPILIKRMIVVLIIVAVLGMLLLLDLTHRGLFWKFAWSVTGEDEPVAQMHGVIQWAVSLTRPQPRTASLVPINHAGVNPYGINTFLEMEADPAKVKAQIQMISDAGFAWIRQQFTWEDLEIDGRGQYTDSRNDIDGDGVKDRIDSWLKYDRIVDLADQYGLQIQARLDNPPQWSRADPTMGAFGPPDDVQDFVNYAVSVAEHYKGRIRHYQVWNEPNLGFEWGERPVNPEAYTELLCRTYNALKQVDPQIVVITGALAPTVDLSGYNLNDFIYLQRMYNAGAGACFDVLSVQGYGLWSGPTDHRMRPTTVTIARNVYIRDLMVANGDENKAIWISEAAWNAVPTYQELPLNADGSDPITARLAFGQVTQDEAAEYIPQLYQRAERDWSWMGVINYWFFTRPGDFERNQSFYYFRMAEPDFDPSREEPFTPLPVYTAMKDHIAHYQPMLYSGTHQAEEHWGIVGDETASVIHVPNAQFNYALQAKEVNFQAHGTDIVIYWSGNELNVNGENIVIDHDASISGWRRTVVAHSMLPVNHEITLSGEFLVLDRVVVANRSYEHVFPLVMLPLEIVFLGCLSLFSIVGRRMGVC